MACIGFGVFNKYYSYIFIIVFFKFFSDYLEGFYEKESYNKSNEVNFIDFVSIFAYHPLLRDFMNFLGAVISGIILYFINKKAVKSKTGLISVNTLLKKKISKLKNIYQKIIIISFIYVISIVLRSFLTNLEFDAGFWTLEIIFVIYLSNKYLKVKIGNHQKVTIIILAVIIFSFQIVNSFLPKTNHHCKDEQCLDKYINDNNLYIFISKKFGHFGFIFLIFFLYTIDFIMRDYSWVKIKFFTDLKSIPIFIIFIFIGIIGCFLIVIAFIITTAVPCNIIENIKFIDGKYLYMDTNVEVDFIREVCRLIDYDDTSKTLKFYYDNFFIIIKDYANSNRKLLEIFIIPIYLFINIAINFSSAMILKNLDPNAMLVNINFNYLLLRMILYIRHDASEEFLTLKEFILLQLCEILAIIAYMIYIELIELKFCDLDHDLKKNIEERSILDTGQLISDSDIDNVEEDEEQEDVYDDETKEAENGEVYA